MATRPKSISIKDFSGAVGGAVARLKIQPSPENGPWFYINPGIVCGLIFNGPIVQAQNLAAAISKDLSPLAGGPLAPIVEPVDAGALGAASSLRPPGHVICGFKHELQISA
jgi:hypothetical protein